MKLTSKQRIELEAIKYFVPSWVEFQPITDEDIDRFFAWSDKGIVPDVNFMQPPFTGLHALYYGKKWRDAHIKMYLNDWGHTLTAWDFREFPKEIAEYLSKRMGKPGIMEVYDQG